MNQQRMGELISAAMDNELNSDERNELLELLKETSSNVRVQDDYAALDRLLRSTPQLEPPAELHDAIMSRISSLVPGKPSLLQKWLPGFSLLPALRYGVAAAAGVLLTIAVYRADLPDVMSGSVSELTGTIAPRPGTASADVVARQEFRRGGVNSELSLQRNATQLFLHIALDSAAPTDLIIDLGGSGTSFDAVEQVEGSLESVSYANEVLRLRGQGKQQILIILHPDAGAGSAGSNSIAVGFASDSEHLGEALLQPIE
jgi:hypothetical protein